eukprot:CAMPEP_0194099372 /NCGR_PEP_ID=MMETSP0150-20130528/554_1 /TAXON_ID=122233 /ORGANISM="Chaetoceros debilis, Strain MM31A-1" /LENGTH=600 /DNA_ID=CAMNT_0038785567 /DNA_START=90 /DNA_END=1892 /DNA_ORIENTATION=+
MKISTIVIRMLPLLLSSFWTSTGNLSSPYELSGTREVKALEKNNKKPKSGHHDFLKYDWNWNWNVESFPRRLELELELANDDNICHTSEWLPAGANLIGEAAEDQSGESIDMSADGSIVAIGTRRNDGAGKNSGHVRIYQRDIGSDSGSGSNKWILLGEDIDGKDRWEGMGTAISLSQDGMTIAITGNNSAGQADKIGILRVYQYNENTNSWTQLGEDMRGKAASDQFGRSLSLSDDGLTVAVGAYQSQDGQGQNSGMVQVFSYNTKSKAWVQKGNSLNMKKDNVPDLNFGNSLSLSGDASMLAIGTKNSVETYTLASNKIEIGNGGDWIGVGNVVLQTVAGLYLNSVSLSKDGSTLAAADDTEIKIFSNTNDSPDRWEQIGNAIMRSTGTDGNVAVRVSKNGSILAIGEDNNNDIATDAGRIQIFQLHNESATWELLGGKGSSSAMEASLFSIDGNGNGSDAAGHKFGYSLAMSEDGHSIAAGSRYSGVEPLFQSGHTRVFDLNCAEAPSVSHSVGESQAPSLAPVIPTVPPSSPVVSPPSANNTDEDPTQMPSSAADKKGTNDSNRGMPTSSAERTYVDATTMCIGVGFVGILPFLFG